jgi:hypothetical protein
MKYCRCAFLLLAALVFSGCDGLYGKLGGADRMLTYEKGDPAFAAILDDLSGVWYSHYAATGRLDGYRIGKWQDFSGLMTGKLALFPAGSHGQTYSPGNYMPDANDYFVFYDDTVFGQSDDGSGGNGGWDGLVTRYIGIVRAVNIFNGDPGRGAIIIEYLQGCAPGWLDRWLESRGGGRPFFGIYYRVLSRDVVQMANAVDLAALYQGERYYTETATLEEAVEQNTVENEAEFISWGVVIPQDREP